MTRRDLALRCVKQPFQPEGAKASLFLNGRESMRLEGVKRCPALLNSRQQQPFSIKIESIREKFPRNLFISGKLIF